jgi:type VI secretion system protein ImpH
MGPANRQFEPGLTASEPPPGGEEAVVADDPAAAADSFDQPRLTEVFWSEPYRFEFFAALRVLARIDETQADTRDEPRSTIDQLQFRSYQSLAFPASEIWEAEKDPGGKRLAVMTVAFLGLTGPLGALPRPYSELIIQRIRKGDVALRDFFDLFNHRLIQIFAHAGAKYRFYLTYEAAEGRQRIRRAQGPQKLRGFLLDERPRLDLFSNVLLSLAGMGTPLLRYKDSVRAGPAPRTELPDATFQHYSGLFSQTHRSAVALGRMVADYFGVPATVVPFVGQWLQLPLEHQTCMRRRDLSGGPPQPGMCAEPRLGQNTVIGSRIWEVQGRFRVRLGPLTFEQFKEYLPVGGNYRPLAHLVRLFAGAAFDFDIQPVLEGSEVPWCQLGSAGRRAPRLGWNTWLRNQEFTAPVDDAIFRVPDQVSMSE